MLLNLLVEGIDCRFCESAGSIIHRDVLQHDVGCLASGPLVDRVLCNRIELIKTCQHRGAGGLPIQCTIAEDGVEGLLERDADIPDFVTDPAFLGFAVGFAKGLGVFLDDCFIAFRVMRQTKHLCNAGRKPLEESCSVRVGGLRGRVFSGFILALVQLDMGIGVCALIYKVNIRDLEML